MSRARGNSLSQEQYEAALPLALDVIRREGKVTNSSLRWATGLNYDQAIKFFNRAITEGVLVRRGKKSGVHYVKGKEL